MIETIEFNGVLYPKFQSEGFAAQYIFPFAKKVCTGVGYDIGCMKREWAFPGSLPIDLSFGDGWNANNLPGPVDYIFSSHCLEHIPNWVETLDYWTSMLNSGGVLFLYLPDYSQEYWRPWNNRKHVNIFSPLILEDYMVATKQFSKIVTSGVDMYNSFAVMGEKC